MRGAQGIGREPYFLYGERPITAAQQSSSLSLDQIYGVTFLKVYIRLLHPRNLNHTVS